MNIVFFFFKLKYKMVKNRRQLSTHFTIRLVKEQKPGRSEAL